MSITDSQSASREKAEALFVAKNYRDAVTAFQAYLDQNPTSAAAMKGLGMSLAMSGNPTEGVEFCRKAAVLQPIEAEYRYAYGYALGALKRFEEATPELDAAVQLQPSNVAARQALVYCLITQGKAVAESDPDKAAAFFERAHNLDRQNADTAAGLLAHYLRHEQTDKAVQVVQHLDAAQREHALIKPIIEKLSLNPAVGAMPGVPPAAAQAPKQVPCPKCAMPIMDFAAICPHCGFQNRSTGTFVGRDTGPDRNWQEIAYMIMSGIWTLMAIYDVVHAIGIGLQGLGGFLAFLAAIRVGIGIGLLLHLEWLAFVAKVLCYITLFSSAYMMMIGFAFGAPIIGLLYLLQGAGTCFLVYLINFEMD